MFKKLKSLFHPEFMTYVHTIQIGLTSSLTNQDSIQLFEYVKEQGATVEIVHSFGGFQQFFSANSEQIQLQADETNPQLSFASLCRMSLPMSMDIYWYDEQSFCIVMLNAINQEVHSQISIHCRLPCGRSEYFLQARLSKKE